MLQLISLIVIAASGYVWYSTGTTSAIFVCGVGTGCSVCFYFFGIFITYLRKELEEVKAGLKQL